MGFFEKWPYTNFHDLNLDKVISKLNDIREIVADMETTVSAFETTDEINSTNVKPVQSRAVYKALQDLMDDISGDISASDDELREIVRAMAAHIQDSLDRKQDILAFDTAPISGSANPVTSNGIYQALETKADDPYIVSVLDIADTDATIYNNMVKALKAGRNVLVELVMDDDTAMDVALQVSTWIYHPNSFGDDRVSGFSPDGYGMTIITGEPQTNGTVKWKTSLNYTTTVTQNDGRPVTSGGVYKAIDSIQWKIITKTATDTNVTLEANRFYIFPEMSALSLTAPTSGECAVRFTSGTTPTTLTVSGAVMPDDFTVEANRVYEINVYEGYGVAQSWEVASA